MIRTLSQKTYGFRLKAFKPKINFRFEVGNFTIKTAQNSKELRKALELRHNVFYQELLNKNKLFRIDIDKFDFIADHIIIIDNKTQNVVGTYRIISSNFSNKFYSETEFDIASIKLLKATKIEIGRASVHKDYRNGAIIALLWKGIAYYAKLVGAKYVFGCSSVQTENIFEIVFAYKYLKQFENKMVVPLPDFRIKNFETYLKTLDSVNIDINSLKVFVPSLIHGYLKAGATICGEPAFDKHFKCADFITLLDADNLNTSFNRRFKS
ncbi:GNAT family N-acetyltransferase [Hydrogenobaculum acidophilum]